MLKAMRSAFDFPPRSRSRIPLWQTLSLMFLLAASPASPGAEAPKLRAQVAGTDIRLSWDAAVAGSGYTILSATDLGAPAWSPLGGASGWPISTTQWSGPRPAGSPVFFRLLVTPPAAPARGGIRSSVRLKTYTVAEMQALLQSYFQPAANALAVEAWKIIYDTVDPSGKPTQASTLVTIPVGTSKPIPLVSYQHGTLTKREDVPSRLAGQEPSIGLILSTSGWIGVLPDYLGMGDSPGRHPYLHAKSEATAVVDALRAARTFVGGRSDVRWNQQLFLTGYSQGGHATLAAMKEIETRHASEFTVTACAPGAGPYDLSGTGYADMISQRQPPNPYYYAYVMMMMSDVYEAVPDAAALLAAPYATTVPPLFDGTHDSGLINAAMPKRPADMLLPGVLADFTAMPDHPLRVALRDNDLHTGWVPQAPLRMYHCQGDLDVLPANTDVAVQTFKAAGAKSVERVDPLPILDHSSCAAFSLLSVKTWFEGLKL